MPPKWSLAIAAVVFAVIAYLCFPQFEQRRNLLRADKGCVVCPYYDACNSPHSLPEACVLFRPTNLHDFLGYIGPAGREQFAFSLWTLDAVFPLAYGGLFATLMGLGHGVPRRGYVLVPIGAALADLAENAVTIMAAQSYTGDPSVWELISPVFTAIKWALSLATAVLVVIRFSRWR